MREKSSGIGSGGAFVWFMQRVSGAVLLLALLVHFWVLHFFPADPQGEITYDIVMQRLGNPLWRTFSLIFLTFGLWHGLNGLILLVHDFIHRPLWRMAVVGTLYVAAVIFFVIGAMTMLGLA